MKRVTVKGRDDTFTAYIRNNLTNTMIKFPVMPQGISENVSANYTQQDIIGASAPRIVYTNTSAKSMSLSLQNLTEDYVTEGFSSLRDYVKALQALAYPEYSGGLVKPPSATLVLGNRSLSCVFTSVGVSWGNLVREQEILSCNVELSLIVTRGDVPGATTIQNENNIF